ncbi:MAG TPA: histidine phosphatase family protein [Burkholderiales bacterium]|jgi:broad specificity phosphatase PhoE|nr:histidine phosphatase family protein [Burkholderiales bacterium]
MAELVLVRHAQASFGSDDYDRLSELGWRQSRWLGEHFAERKLAFDRVVRGTLRRHVETLAGIGEGMGVANPACEERPGLNEYDSLALLRAHTGKEVRHQRGDQREHFRVLREALYAWCDGSLACGDELSFKNFRAGVLQALEAARAGGARRVLVVSSGGPISTIVAEVLKMPMRGVVELNLRARNTGISEFHFNERGIHCVSFNGVPHLDRPDRPNAITYA